MSSLFYVSKTLAKRLLATHVDGWIWKRTVSDYMNVTFHKAQAEA